MRFEFATATRIIAGPGSLREVGELAKGLGRRAMVVTGRNVGRSAALQAYLQGAGITCFVHAISGEPTIDAIREAVKLAKAESVDLVLGFGGGGAVDAGKAVAAMLPNEGDLLDYVEVIGRGRVLERPPLPFIAIPTTAGTGAEVTRNAVLGSPEHGLKVSLRSALMLPRVALVDPELALTLPPAVTAATGLDALTQLVEPYVSLRANPITDALCVDGIRRITRSLRRAFEHGNDLDAREDMALAALQSGMALANAGLGVVHGLAAPIGGMFSAPHGAVCAALLPHVMQVNVQALVERAPRHPSLRRYEEVARLVTGSREATLSEGLQCIAQLTRDLGVAQLASFGVSRADFRSLVEKAAQASSMKANPIVLNMDELTGVLERALN